MQALGPSVFAASSPLALGYSWQAQRLASDRIPARIAFGAAIVGGLFWTALMVGTGVNLVGR
jgi:hypothetical protein